MQLPMNRDANKEADFELIAEIDSASHKLILALHNNGLECRATFEPKENGEPVTPAEIHKILDSAGLTYGIDNSMIEEFCSGTSEGEPQENILLAVGTPPVPGADGWLELAVRSSTDEAQYEEDENGKIDHRNRQSFENVEPGQLVGNIRPPQEGEAGRTVRDEEIPPISGKELKLVTGKGVRIDEDGRSVISEATGRLVYEEEENTIQVTDELIIKGDVDFHVGHIDFAGFVTVNGDVLDDFNVKATKGITVTGAVGACQIITCGDVIISSMYGKDRGKIKCIGNLHANHLANVEVECDGNVTVSKEIRDSIIKSLGTIRVENGNIGGGEYIALAGIEAKEMGSVFRVHTEIISGVSYLDSKQQKDLQKRLETINYQIKHITYTLGNIFLQDSDSLSDAVKRRSEVLAKTLERTKKEEEFLLKKMEIYLAVDQLAPANPKINVVKLLHEGVIVELGNIREKMALEVEGPTSIIESKKDSSLLYLTLSPLRVKAADALKKHQGKN